MDCPFQFALIQAGEQVIDSEQNQASQRPYIQFQLPIHEKKEEKLSLYISKVLAHIECN